MLVYIQVASLRSANKGTPLYQVSPSQNDGENWGGAQAVRQPQFFFSPSSFSALLFFRAFWIWVLHSFRQCQGRCLSASLTPAKLKQFLESAMKGDTNLDSVRKTIVRFSIREIILDNERLIITYNFTDNNLPKKAISDKLDKVVETAKAVVDNSSNVLDSVPPKGV